VPFGQAAESSVSLWDPVVPDRADSPRRASRPVAEPERPSSFVSRPAADPPADQPAPAPGPEPWLFGSPGNGSRPDRGGDPQTDEFARVDDVDDEYRREEFAYGAAGAGPRIWRPAPEEDRSSAFGGPPTEAAGPLFRDDGIDDDTDDEDGDPDYDRRMSPAGLDGPVDLEPRRRLGRGSSEATGRVWVTVVAQWILGALVGAALWVGFRFLWRSLPVVALAAAVLVTVGLVVIVRALLRNDGMRTTLFALLVGLLLTVSPAILVLLNR
jgi:hypothetical protein